MIVGYVVHTQMHGRFIVRIRLIQCYYYTIVDILPSDLLFVEQEWLEWYKSFYTGLLMCKIKEIIST